MAHEELELLSKILDSGDLRKVQEANVTADHFHTENGLMIWKAIIEHWQDRYTAGEVPTREQINRLFPTVDLPRPDRRSLASVLQTFLSEYLTTELLNAAVLISDKSEAEPLKVLSELDKLVAKLSRDHRSSKDVVLSASVQEAIHRYETNRDGTGFRGIPYPWMSLNEETQGMNNGEFIILYGRPKSMKTWVLLSAATHAYDYANRKVLVYTREMTPQQMMDRCICLLIGAPYSAYKKGTLSDIMVPEGGTMEDRFYFLVEGMKADEEVAILETGYNKSIIITSDRDNRSGGGGVNGLRGKVRDWKPDLVCVDAMYLMRNDRENKRSIKWDQQAAITQDLKELALSENVPLLGTTQAKRESEEKQGQSVSNISFSDSYGMDCDLAIEIGKKKIDDEHNELALSITGAREINMSGFAIHGNAASDFSQIMKPLTDEAGVVRTENGETKWVPVVFKDTSDIKSFFKVAGSDERAVRPKSVNAQMAAEAFAAARAKQ